jgi:hypothetical protein
LLFVVVVVMVAVGWGGKPGAELLRSTRVDV